MNAVPPICLTDLAPALRWSAAVDVDSLLQHARLVDGWWQSYPLTRVVEITGPTWLAQGLARLAVTHWEHLTLREFLPTLCAISVDMAEIAEPVRGAVLATAGSWQQLTATSPATMREWEFPENCGLIDVISTVTLRVVQPFGAREDSAGPTPSPALMLEAVRTITNWMPSSAPEHVHNALEYLSAAVGAETEESTDVEHASATRAIRTLRALRTRRGADDQARGEATEAATSGTEQRAGSLIGPGGTLRRPAFGPPKGTPQEPPSESAVPGREGPSDTSGMAEPPPSPFPRGEHPLVDVLDQLVRQWGDLERTVAAERLFAADPVSVRELAERLRVDVAHLRNAQRTVEERLLQWLGSAEGAPVTDHLKNISEQLGAATTIDHLITAHPDHPVEIPALGTPLWRVVITLFTDRRLHDGWLVTTDPHQLRWQTRQLLTGRPGLTEAGTRLAKLGIRPPAVRAWLLSTPGVSIRDGYVLLDAEATPDAGGGPAGFPAQVGAMPNEGHGTAEHDLPIRRRPTAAQAHQEPVPTVSESARCFRAPDGRWWHRIDVTADHLNGAPVTVPPGYATHLGLQAGRLLCLTAPGADLLVLVWREQPAFDSLRPLLRRLSAQPGDHVFITVEGDRLDARLLSVAEFSDHSPPAKALHLIGYTAPASTEEALEIIARRIADDDASKATDQNQLLDALTQRGDTDIVAELRPSLYATR